MKKRKPIVTRTAAELAEVLGLSPLEGAHIFNLAGEVIHMDAFLSTLRDIDMRASELITASGPQVPVAFRMDDSQLREKVGHIHKTPLVDGVTETYQRFRRLRETVL